LFVTRGARTFDASDLVTAVADDWSSTKVVITRWQHHQMTDGRSSWDAGPWERVSEPFDGVIGDAGLAWGDGLHGDGAPKGHDGPVKREGDHKSPAGAFRITRQFGFEDRGVVRALTEQTECVDDPSSRSYNLVVERTGSADWTSSEHMRSVPLYALGAVIDHNPKRVAGDGSCIFLHIWGGPDSTTVGCTAMPRERLEELLRGLGRNAVLVELPKAEYDALAKPWGLPAL
jgi:L,D-peptidoglycan transpeptidase YkuD (ErfK/YbiS/YcfS/YnhG family)